MLPGVEKDSKSTLCLGVKNDLQKRKVLDPRLFSYNNLHKVSLYRQLI